MKITTNYLRTLIKEQIEEEKMEEGAGKLAGAVLALFAAGAGLSAKQQIDKFQAVMSVAQQEKRGWDELSALYKEKTGGGDAKADNMDMEDLKIFAAAEEIKNSSK